MNWLTSILILLTAYLVVGLEATFEGLRHLLGAQIDLLPALMVYTALTADFITLTVLAAAGGLWLDSLSANPLGVSVAPLLAVGCVIYSRRALILRDQYFARFFLGLGASAAVPVLTLLLLLSSRHTPLLGWASLWQWLVMSLGGAAFTPLCFRFFDGLHHAFRYQPALNVPFRPDREIRRGRK